MTGRSTIDASFDDMMGYVSDYLKESVKSQHLERALDKYDLDDHSFGVYEQYDIGVDLLRNDGDPTVWYGYYLGLLAALKVKLQSQFSTLVSDRSIPLPPNLDSRWDDFNRKWESGSPTPVDGLI